MFSPFETIETLINKTLLLDPKSKHRLKNLDGKHIKVEVRNLNLKFPLEISFNGTGLHSSSGTGLHPGIHISLPKLAVFDAIIHGPLAAFLCLAVTKDPHKAALLGLNFEGNVEVAQMVQELFMDLDIDWEEPLSKLTNDSFAHSIGQFFKTFKKNKFNLFSSLTHSMTEYLQEESKVLPSPNEAEAFYQDIEELRDRVERSEARLERLEKLIEDEKVKDKGKGNKHAGNKPNKHKKPNEDKKLSKDKKPNEDKKPSKDKDA